MALQVWLPLNSEALTNKGMADVTVTNYGATFNVTGKFGTTFHFDGSNDYIQIEWDKWQSLYSGDFSICLWVYADEAQSNAREILFGNYGFTGCFAINCELRYGLIRFYWHGSPDWVSSATVEASKWTHIVYTRSGTTVKIYKDGILADTRTGAMTSLGTISSNIFMLGKDTRDGATALKGRLNDFRIYDHCLSPKEVKEISLGLYCHYKLDGYMNGATDNLGLSSKWLSNTYRAKTNKLFSRRTANDTYEDMGNGVRASVVSTSFGGLAVYANQLGLKVGQKYTYSFMAYHTGCTAPNFSFYPIMYNSSGTRDTSSKLPIYVSSSTTWTEANARAFGANVLTTSPQRYYCAFEWNQTMQDIIDNGGNIELSIQGHGNLGSSGTFHFYEPKLEEGFNQNPTWNANSSEIGVETDVVYDASGFGNDATAVGNILVSTDTPRNSCCMDFPSGSYIKNTNFVFDTKYWTVSLWYYKPSNPLAYEILYCLSKDNGGTDSNKKFCAAPNSGRIWYKAESGTATIYKLKVGEWTMLTMASNGTTATIYENAVQIGTISEGTQLTGRTDLSLAARTSSANAASFSTFYTGKLSDFRIYASCLSADDIKALYETTASIDNKGNMHAYEFVESGTSRELLAVGQTYPKYSSGGGLWPSYNSIGEWLFSGENSSTGTSFIPISPNGKTYYYDITLSASVGNQIYVGFEIYDANKQSGENKSTRYVISTKPTVALDHQRYFGTVDLSNLYNVTGTPPAAYIRLRVLSGWSGSTDASNATMTIHNMSLREVITATGVETQHIKFTGNVLTDEFREGYTQAKFMKNGFLETNEIIEY